MVALDGYFPDFVQIKIDDCTELWLQKWLFSILNLSKLSLAKTGYLGSPYFLFTGCLSIRFFESSLIPTRSVRLPLVTYPSLWNTCVAYRTPCHSTGHQVLPTQPLPREAEDFPRGGKHSKHVLLLTYLA